MSSNGDVEFGAWCRKLTSATPVEIVQEDMDIEMLSMTLTKGKDCVVYLEHFSKSICLGRLIYPYAVNLQLDVVMPDRVKLTLEALDGDCEVAITGRCVEESDDEGCCEDPECEGECHMQSDDEDIQLVADGDAAETTGESENAHSSSSSEEEKEEEVQMEEVKSDSSEESDGEESNNSESSEELQAEVEKPKPVEKKSDKKVDKKNATAVVKQPTKKEAAKPEAGKKVSMKRNLGGGIYYEITKTGSGQPIPSGKKVEVQYAVMLAANGKKVDSGKLPLRLGAGEVVSGFEKGVADMCPSESRRIFVPAKYAYGSKRTGPIPPNSDLIFDVTMIRRVK